MLSGTRRISNNLLGSLRQSSLQKSRSNIGRQSALSPAMQQSQSKEKLNNQLVSGGQSINYAASSYHSPPIQQQNTQAFLEAFEENKRLKREMDELLNGSSDFGNSSNVALLQHYSHNQQESAIINEQEEKIRKLEEVLRNNEARINLFKKGAEELQVRMNNIQSLDREIYKTLQGSVNRDKELLDKATSALARGERREEVAKILEQIISG